MGSIPDLGTKDPHAMEQLSPCITTTEAHARLSLSSATRDAITMRSMCTATGESPHTATKSQRDQKERERKIMFENHHILLLETWSTTVLWFVILQFQPPFGPKLKSLRVGLGIPRPIVCQATQAQWTRTRGTIVLETHGGPSAHARGRSQSGSGARQAVPWVFVAPRAVCSASTQFLTSCLLPGMPSHAPFYPDQSSLSFISCLIPSSKLRRLG